MNILFIHEVDLLKKVVFEIHSWSEMLSSLGHNVYVIDFEHEWSKENVLDIGSLKTKVFDNISRTTNGSSTTLIRPGFIKTPFVDRATALFTHYFEIERVINEKEIDIIILYSVPTNGYQTVKLAGKYNVPVLFRSIDTLHMLVPTKALRPITFSLEKWVYKHVDKILTLSPKLSEYVIRLGAEKDNVEMLPFCVDTNAFNSGVGTQKLKQRLGLTKEHKIVVFIGTLFEFSGLDLYIKQFPKVVKEVPNVKLVIVGGGILLNKLKELVTELNLKENVILTGFEPFELMPQFINIADVCINPFLINSTTQDIIPGKVIQYLACAKPVLATPLPGMVSLLFGPEHGIIYSEINQFAKNTIKILKHDDFAKSVGKNGYLYVKSNHCEQKISHRLSSVLSQMVKKRLILE
ncbi:MAG: glycosyltransferase [Candidatus Bathyarchaeota archaeon]|nr:glycosyltransferase [Candidatus Bathyarchaeum sp.]